MQSFNELVACDAGDTHRSKRLYSQWPFVAAGLEPSMHVYRVDQPSPAKVQQYWGEFSVGVGGDL